MRIIQTQPITTPRTFDAVAIVKKNTFNEADSDHKAVSQNLVKMSQQSHRIERIDTRSLPAEGFPAKANKAMTAYKAINEASEGGALHIEV